VLSRSAAENELAESANSLARDRLRPPVTNGRPYSSASRVSARLLCNLLSRLLSAAGVR
jgi:hypothetical protein